MPIDEFGREIPAAGSAATSHPTPFADPLRDEPTTHPTGSSSTNNPLLSGGELSAPRDTTSGSLRDDPTISERGSGEGRRREYDNHSEGRFNHNSSHRGRGRGRGRGRHNINYRGRPRSDSGYSDDNRRRHRSRSYGGDGDDHHRHGGSQQHHHRSSQSQSSRGSMKRAHASERYVEQPMLCQFLWKKELEDNQAKELGLVTDKLNTKSSATGGVGEASSSKDGGASSNNMMIEATDTEENSNNNPQQEEETNDVNQIPAPPPLFESTEIENQAYHEYNNKYCLNYVRTFFNHHLDDPWFRKRLSPLESHRAALKEIKRAKIEANELKKEIQQSLDDMTSGVIPKKDPDCAEYLGPPKCNFVAGCRLGVGTKPTAAHTYHHHHHGHYNNHYNNNDQGSPDFQHNVLQGEDRNRIERHAKSHLHSFIKSECCIKIMDVPSNVSDDQLLVTLREHVNKGDAPPLAVYSDDVCVPIHDNVPLDPYARTAYAIFPSSISKDCMLESLHKANEEANRSSSHRDRGGRHRKGGGGNALPRVLDLDVDCTDVYGRREEDADGKGGAPPAPLGKKKNKKKDVDDTPRLPTKRCTVYVSTSLLSSSQPVSVLSAAVSSRKRISQDREDASTIAGIYDEVRGIEAGSRLSDLLRLLYPGNELQTVDDEDILDVSIAYLRRVHLFSFYNGCVASENVGNVLSFTHPTGTIHLRLRDADEILTKSAEERGPILGGAGDDDAAMAEEGASGESIEKKDDDEGTPDEVSPDAGKDLLVMRLNDSISKALENVKVLAERGPSCLIDAETDAAARNIDVAEQSTRQAWIDNHGILDGDGRARCSFHFCRKLFKDKAFLVKHLIKKHSDQLRAETAKCHDGAMMAAWDNDELRPVPPVLIDCGSKFGLVPSPVTGTMPAANDPEPELWKEEQERIAEEERIHREREAAARAKEEEMQRRREMANAGEKRKSNFVDPDDMVEEKVELSFENVEVVAPPPKKKKKKKKSLL